MVNCKKTQKRKSGPIKNYFFEGLATVRKMGVKNLLPNLKDITHRVNLNDLVKAHLQNPINCKYNDENVLHESLEVRSRTKEIYANGDERPRFGDRKADGITHENEHFIQSTNDTKNIRDFVVGVDASGWLYKAAFTCPDRVSR